MSDTYRDRRKAKQKRGLVPYDWHWLSSWPRWWDVMHHRRPPRRRQAALLHRVMRGEEPVAWPDYRKPHVYYW